MLQLLQRNDHKPSVVHRAVSRRIVCGSAANSAVAVDRRGMDESLCGRQHLVQHKEKSSIIGILGAKGGVGATTLAINLSVSIATNHGSTTFVNANLQQPDAAVMLGQRPKYNLLDLLSKTGDLQKEISSSCRSPLCDRLDNCFLLTPPLSGEAVLKTNLSQLSQCMRSLSSDARYWIIDLPKAIDSHLISVLDSCDLIVLVLEATAGAVANARRWLNVFDDLNYQRTNIAVVANRAGSKAGLLEDELREMMGDSSVLAVPNSSALCRAASLQATPASLLSPKDRYSRAITDLARNINCSPLPARK